MSTAEKLDGRKSAVLISCSKSCKKPLREFYEAPSQLIHIAAFIARGADVFRPVSIERLLEKAIVSYTGCGGTALLKRTFTFTFSFASAGTDASCVHIYIYITTFIYIHKFTIARINLTQAGVWNSWGLLNLLAPELSLTKTRTIESQSGGISRARENNYNLPYGICRYTTDKGVRCMSPARRVSIEENARLLRTLLIL